MDALKDFYRAGLKWLAGAIVAVALAYHELTTASSLSPRLTSGVQSAITALLFLLGEWFIRTRLWRLASCHRDYSGDWKATTKYVNVEIGSSTVSTGLTTAIPPADHSVTIEQDCFSIAIRPTTGAFNSWYSLAMNILSDDKLCYVYEVNYLQPNQYFPPLAKGYEEMTVVERQKEGLLKGRPTRMTGVFYHCAQGKVPVYSGTVEFQRILAMGTVWSVLRGR